jgi:hypothetical protein
MANTNAPFGLRPVRYLNGAPWNGQVSRYLIPATDGTAMFIGDPVTLAGDAGASGSYVNGVYTAGMPTVSIGIAGATCVGAIVGFEVNPSGLDAVYRAASVARVALVADDPMIVFHVQEANSGTAWTSAEIGLNANFVSASGSTVTGYSAYVGDNSTEATTSTLNLKLLRLAPIETNDYGVAAIWEVLLNNHAFRTGVAGA